MEFTSVMVTGSSVSTGRFSSRRLTAGVGRPQLQGRQPVSYQDEWREVGKREIDREKEEEVEEVEEVTKGRKSVSSYTKLVTTSQNLHDPSRARSGLSWRTQQEPPSATETARPTGWKGPRAPATAASGDEEARLTSWEQFLTTRKPIIAPDGYIPNSVIRAVLGHVTSGQSHLSARCRRRLNPPSRRLTPSSLPCRPATSRLHRRTERKRQLTITATRLTETSSTQKWLKSPRSGRRSAQRTPSASDTKSQGRQEAKKVELESPGWCACVLKISLFQKSSADITKQMLRTRTRADVENITRDGGMSSRMGASMSNDSQFKLNNVLDATTDPTTTISKQFNSKGLNDFEDDMLDVCDDRDNGDEEHLISMSSSSA
ncbi:hypothetical protein C0Q70_01362 [Pomacea canaliculata]|uniref:Uncharacterized protein n=1 Tax=Pomacea canaliculata TaxID=400727 RepID=A0A2T7PZA8_POMCA|nr:hypothetical protein C0Q70_01362 [Pomacea canaliculata]